ncbi:SDR family oxidoreductase [Fulvivirga sp. M361]|uniref:SDR family NAD(P)-dependent oxidoreductase n=1 Tax=Fulvivirga sp. M361 TaxID=2594266 RepID=UPI00117B8B10|nr:SDR family oxidoreductase [Fulvivirga sp. M361]TRX53042.1 SDR family oxidoreductase [Fulvivirga sp. M361]
MKDLLSNKIALVTGGSRGLGKNEALKLAELGSDVIITFRSQKEEAQQVVNEIESQGRKALALQLDVSQTDSFDHFFEDLITQLKEKWGKDKFDFLVNNAGIDNSSLFSQFTEKAFDDLYNVHLKGTFFFTQKALAFMNDGGRIINTSTGLARFTIPGYSAYAAMKGAIEVFTRYLAKELGHRSITANVIAPGAIETDFNAPAFHANPQLKDTLAAQTALGRVGMPDDVGGIVAFLCTEHARWINAQRIEASGGMFL